MTSENGTGSLKGIRIVEFAGVGPGPFCAMLLADMGAEIISLDRTTPHGLGVKKEPRFDPTTRSRALRIPAKLTDESDDVDRVGSCGAWGSDFSAVGHHRCQFSVLESARTTAGQPGSSVSAWMEVAGHWGTCDLMRVR